ncbi:MAG: hypothetical protein F2793_01765 [Actinobacteria bacterium]|uniref:Unannotated protein n=1 Tax=freshwater metagenome TaxID=449393 RepID=A0A6J7D0I4_9ZZZZ|nr:hypothetical protein [Actinomycetota bacterium]
MRTMTKTAALATMGLALVTLSACSSSSTSTPATPAASASMVGGMTECTNEAVGQAATEAAAAQGAGNVFTLETLTCDSGWAVAAGTLGDGSTASDAPQGAPTSYVFEAEGQFWVPQDKAKVCGTPDAANPTTAPADATIPPALYAAGCAAG